MSTIPKINGFLYQIPVTIYHVLKLMNDFNKDDLNEDEFKNYKVRIEDDATREDFLIYHKRTCKSYHQVKARKEDRMSAYTKDDDGGGGALGKLQWYKDKECKSNNNVECYLHVSTDIIAKDKAKIKINYPGVNLYRYLVDDIDQEYCELECKAEDIYIIKLCEKQLKQYLAKKNPMNIGETGHYYWKLYYLCIHNINSRHNQIRKTNPSDRLNSDIDIEFSQFAEILQQDSNAVCSIDSVMCKLKYDLISYMQQYLTGDDGLNHFCSVHDQDGNCTNCVKTSLIINQLSESIINKTTEDMKKFVSIIEPHRNLLDLIEKRRYERILKEFIHIDSIKYGYCPIITAIKRESDILKIGLVYNKSNFYYIPTAITREVSATPFIENNIKDNSQNIRPILSEIHDEFLEASIEIDYFITKYNNSVSLNNNICDIFSEDLEDDSEDKDLKKKDQFSIGNAMKLQLITLDRAKEQLNDMRPSK